MKISLLITSLLACVEASNVGGKFRLSIPEQRDRPPFQSPRPVNDRPAAGDADLFLPDVLVQGRGLNRPHRPDPIVIPPPN